MKKVLIVLALSLFLSIPSLVYAYGGGGPSYWIPVDEFGNTSWSEQVERTYKFV